MTMKWAGWTGVIVMTGALIFGFSSGDFGASSPDTFFSTNRPSS